MSKVTVETIEQLNALAPDGQFIESLPVVTNTFAALLQRRAEVRGRAEEHVQTVLNGLFQTLDPTTVISALSDAFASVDESIRQDREQLVRLAQQCGLSPELAGDVLKEHVAQSETSRRFAMQQFTTVATVTVGVVGAVTAYIVTRE